MTSTMVVGLSIFTVPASAATACTEAPIDAIRASTYESVNPPSNAIDNDMSSRWSGEGKGAWLRAQLDERESICRVDIAWYRGNTRTNDFVIAVSSDGSSWKNVYSGKSSGDTSSEEKYSFSDTNARYVRVTVNGNTENNWASISELDVNTRSDSSTTSSGSSLDKFGIEKIYPTASGGNEWYVNMADPRSDSLFRNLPTMTKQSDGSWRVSASQVRMEAWSPSNEKWRDIEITAYAKMVSGTPLIQLYSRGGHHYSDPDKACEGSAYKARLYGNGNAGWVKEVNHPAYTSTKGIVDATDRQIEDRWVGFKAVIYNVVENGKTYVRLENYIDDDVTGSNGNLVVRNNWKLASVVVDKGGWSTTNSDFDSRCAPLNKDSNDSYRQRDEILNMPGGTSSQNIAAWRSDGLTWDWKYLSVREISAH
ncbi:MAG TPA: discoidin domain-containing protein [Nitrososphaera sp.]|nr:discoidin domain-containing protein [Nitrososphaera sp.]